MKLYEIPFLNGKKSLIAGYGLIVLGFAGFVATFGDFLTAIGQCLDGTLTIQQCAQQSQMTFLSLLSTFKGLGDIGIAHKIEKAS